MRSGGGGIVKTVILPNEEMNRLGMEYEHLQTFLIEQQKLNEDTLLAYKKDKTIREEEFKLKEVDILAKIQDTKQRLQQ